MKKQIVLDNSVVMSWCFEDEANPYADHVLDSLAHTAAIAPSIWPLEVSNVLVVAERKKRLTHADCLEFLQMLSRLPIEVFAQETDNLSKDIYLLAREAKLSTYDAAYLDLALRKGQPLATLDNALIKAAGKFNVELFS